MAAAGMIGQLTVQLLEGKGLYNVNLLMKMDPYCLLTCGSSDEKFRARPCRDGHKAPTWSQSFIFNLLGREDALHIQVWNKGTVTDTQIGRLDLLLPQLTYDQPLWYNIVARDNFSKTHGQLLLQFHWSGRGGGPAAAASAARGSVASSPIPMGMPMPMGMMMVPIPGAQTSPAVGTTPVPVGAVVSSPSSSSSTPLNTDDAPVSKAAPDLPTPVVKSSAPTYVTPAGVYPQIEGQPPSYADAALAPGGPPMYAAIYQLPVYGPHRPSTSSGSSSSSGNGFPGTQGYSTPHAPAAPAAGSSPANMNGYPGVISPYVHAPVIYNGMAPQMMVPMPYYGAGIGSGRSSLSGAGAQIAQPQPTFAAIPSSQLYTYPGTKR